ncbi:protein of unknown function [Oenococcus oeni]|uniref:Uncharacterized protein n=1 Tax=Oenococcus oeni TaxID=1247 RepID=A0AAQ2ZFR6_OENOE|nr:hypothetical protein OENI_850007 [Oenococcus oeni]VDB98049.1 protein of unknown function [Oenococcus oeni]
MIEVILECLRTIWEHLIYAIKTALPTVNLRSLVLKVLTEIYHVYIPMNVNIKAYASMYRNINAERTAFGSSEIQFAHARNLPSSDNCFYDLFNPIYSLT